MYHFETRITQLQRKTTQLISQLMIPALLIPIALALLTTGCTSDLPAVEASKLNSQAMNNTPAGGIGTGGGVTAALFINCPTTLQAGGSGTCSVTVTGTLAAFHWTVNSVKEVSSDNRTSYSWPLVTTPGTYAVQAVGSDSSGKPVSSNTVNVLVTAAPAAGGGAVNTASIFISCPSNVVVGGSAACSSTLTGSFISGTWTVDGAAQPAGTSLNSYMWSNIPTAGSRRIQLIGRTASGAAVSSNTVTVMVTAAPPAPSVSIMCPSRVAYNGTGTCTATASATVVPASIFWRVNGLKVEGSDGKSAYSWYNLINSGAHNVQAVAMSTTGSGVVSNIISVTIENPPAPVSALNIYCPSTVFIGESPSCTATSTIELASGYWTLDGVKIEGSDNMLTISFENVQTAGVYRLQGVAIDVNGNRIMSNIITTTVRAR